MSQDRLTRNYLRIFAHTREVGLSAQGGVDRMALTPGDVAAREWLERRLGEVGAQTRVDAAGNLFGLFEWVPGEEYVLVGSHLDSQPNGGFFDGAYGVVCALSAAIELDRRVKAGRLTPARNLAVVGWTGEEGSRFQPSVLGSRVFTGAIPLEEALASRDASGVTLAQALADAGFAGVDEPPRACAYVELHVEQGSVLAENNADIGLVSSSWAAAKTHVEVVGEQSHTGCTPMERRRDAVYGAARAICAIHDLPKRSEGLRTSATCVRSQPESPNTVAARCSFHAEVRAEDALQVRHGLDLLDEALAKVAAETGLAVSRGEAEVREPQAFWPAGVRLAGRVARSMRLSALRMKTVCGHDSVALNAAVPTVMLFVPSEGGAAHSPDEQTTEHDQINGVHELFGVARELVCEQHLDRKRPRAPALAGARA